MDVESLGLEEVQEEEKHDWMLCFEIPLKYWQG